MLKQRIITALILAPISIAGVFFLPPDAFSVFIGVFLALAAWEWAGFAAIEGAGRVVYAAGIVVLLAGSLFVPPVLVLGIGIAWWALALVLVMSYPGLSSLWSSRLVRALLGIVNLVPGFVALVQLKRMPESDFLILLLFLLIWGADIGAYFAGRAFGRHKLAPAVSPGKTWEGVYGGMALALAIAAGMVAYRGAPNPGSADGAIFLLGCSLVVVVSVLGDLAESMFKRYRGVKDSSHLLPGHGGFMDRLDSLLAAGPVFALFVLFYGF